MLATEEAVITFPIHCGGELDPFFGVDPNSWSPVLIALKVADSEVQHILNLSLSIVGWSHLRACDFYQI